MKPEFVEWVFNPLDYEKAIPLSEQLGVSVYTAQLLLNRGVSTVQEANTFLTIPHSLEMESWDKDKSFAIGKRILKAIENKELITVHGDYDVDGVTGAAVLSQFLKSKGANFNYFLPDRFGDGYGVSANTIKNLAENGTKILITADCGISNHKEIELANTLGIEVIVTDHHTLPETLPEAKYIFHPGLSPDKKFHILSGVGTAFQLIYDIDKMIPSVTDIAIEDYLDLVTIGTIADISPLKGINRSLVQYGLTKIKNTKRLGLLTLLEKAGVKMELFSARDISHKIVPRLNAAGRMNKATIALEMLLADTEEEAQLIAQRLEDLNKERQKLCETTFLEIEELIAKEVNLDTDKAIVLAKEGFHHGVIGILCSRVLEKYNRPAFIMAKEGELSRGSARSTNINLVDALKSAEDLLIKFGGHPGAAGWSLKTENFEEFRKKILEYTSKNLTKESMSPKVEVEVEIPINKIDYYLYRELQELEPFGLNNPEPVIGIRDCNIADQQLSKNGLHLFFQAVNEQKGLKTNFWNGAALYPLENKVDMVYSVTENSWNGRISLQLRAKYLKNSSQRDIKPLKQMSKLERDSSVEIEFPISQLMTPVTNQSFITNSFGQHQVNFPEKIDKFNKNVKVHDLRACLNRFDELFLLFEQYGFENINIFSTGKIKLPDNIKARKTDIEKPEKHLIIWDLPLKKEHLHHIMNIVDADNVYMFFEKKSVEDKKIDGTTLKEILKNLYVHNDSMNEFMNACQQSLKLDKEHLSISLGFLLEAKYILEHEGKNFIKLLSKGVRLSELDSYSTYLKEKSEYQDFCNIMLKGSLNKINNIIEVTA